MNIAVILAGGTGNRFGSDSPKQFATVGGQTILGLTVKVFAANGRIDEICVVSHKDWIDHTHDIVQATVGESKKFSVIEGGDERYMSSLNAVMKHIDYPDDTNLIFHDAARPCLDASVLDAVLDALAQSEAVAVGTPCTDTLWEVAVTGEAMKQTPTCPYSLLRVPERRRYWMAQTPQAFRLPVIRDAWQRALQDPMFQATDDCSVVSRYKPETKIRLVQGNADNLKITHPHDLEILRTIMKQQL